MRLPFLNRRISPLFPISLVTIVLLIVFVISVPPTWSLTIPFLSIPAIFFLLFLAFLLCFALGTLAFTSRFHGFLLASCVVGLLILRMNGFKHPMYVVLIVALFITLEFFFSSSNKKPHAHSARQDHAKDSE